MHLRNLSLKILKHKEYKNRKYFILGKWFLEKQILLIWKAENDIYG